MVAGRPPEGLGHAEVIDHRPGTGWSAERWPPCAMVVDDTGWGGNRQYF
ncbi:MAG: hypothetical protein ACJ74K_15200 [Actinomycetes bacterium]